MNLNELFNYYQSKRHSCLNIDQFSSMLVMYPAAEVAMADGEFSEFERVNLASALKEACDGNDFAMCEMYSELCSLLNADSEMRKNVIECMKAELVSKPEIKLIILELMISTADADDGISEVEKEKINELKIALGI